MPGQERERNQALLLSARRRPAVKLVERRIGHVEERLAPRCANQILIVVTDAGQKLALDKRQVRSAPARGRAPQHDELGLLRRLREDT